jgi:hypothetical protein
VIFAPVVFSIFACTNGKINENKTISKKESSTSIDSVLGIRANSSQFIQIQGQNFYLGNEIYYIKGVNYWPADFGWTAMWNHDEAWTNGVMSKVVQQDFKRTSELGANTVRIIAPYVYFSGPDSSKYHNRLNFVLTLARINGLRVILTLFDWASNEELTAKNFPGHDAYLREFATRYGQNPTIMAWDIQNEPDHRYMLEQPNPAVRSDVVQFLTRSYSKLKEFGVRQPVSAGLYGHYLKPRYPAQSIDDTDRLIQTFDFSMFHWYESADGLRYAISAALKNGGKPVLVEELGVPSGGNRFSGKYSNGTCALDRSESATPSSQEKLFKEWAKVVGEFKTSLSGVVVWDLIDHSESTATLTDAFCPGDITGYFGLYQTNGQIKPSGNVFKYDFPLFMGQSAATILVDRISRQVLGRKCSTEECQEPVSRVVSQGTSEAALRKSMANPRERLVRQWYKGYLDRLADDSGLAYYLEKLDSGIDCRTVATIFLGVLNYQGELGTLYSNEEFVKKMYQGFLGRQPDVGGNAYWVGGLNSQETREKMVSYFLNSPEFYARCQ